MRYILAVVVLCLFGVVQACNQPVVAVQVAQPVTINPVTFVAVPSVFAQPIAVQSFSVDPVTITGISRPVFQRTVVRVNSNVVRVRVR
jgi:hypothetical protein